jgi:archaellum biogenesis ATPase FlaH
MTEIKIDQELIQQYVDLGWIIVPTGKDEDGKYKKPLKSWKQFNTLGDVIKPTAEEIWYDINQTFRGKVYGIGAITGTHSNLLILDLDDYKEETNFEQIKKIMSEVKTPIAKTGGGGYHIYFNFNENIKTQVNLIKGLDTRGQGGYVVLPPSLHHSGKYYEWVRSPLDTPLADLPQELLSILPKRRDNQIQPNQQFQLFDFTKKYFQGERDATMFSGARSIIKMLPKHRWLNAGLPLYLSWAKDHIVDNADGFVSEDNLIKKFNHALSYETSENPISSNLIDLVDNETLIENLFNKDRFGIKTGYTGFDFKTGGVLSSNLTLISAQTGIGKSLVFMNLLNNISQERKVAYLDLENGILETLERLIRIRYGLTKEFFHDTSNAPKIKSLIEQGFGNYNYLSTNSKIRKPEVLLAKVKELIQKGVQVFVIDPLQKMEGGNDLKLAGEIVGELSDLSKEHNIAIMLCHHVRKSPNSGGSYIKKVDDSKDIKFLDPELEDIKGGSIIPDTAENVWMISRNVRSTDMLERSKLVLKVVKCRTNGNALGDFGFFLDLNNLRIYDKQENLSFNLKGTMYDAYMKG